MTNRCRQPKPSAFHLLYTFNHLISTTYSSGFEIKFNLLKNVSTLRLVHTSRVMDPFSLMFWDNAPPG